MDMEQSEEFKQAEMLAISNIIDKRNTEIGQINDKYES